ncbi:MAG: phosphoribosyltransferase [Desulfurococcales archaeon]|nr:phosphoribosyltransferase [Desulfurococcales archaeon]
MARVPVKLVSWSEIVEWSRGLAGKIEASGYRPDVIVAVARGGYVPARLLADFLDVTNMLSVQSQHWVEAAKAAERAILKYPYKVDLEGGKVLLVDDIVDTGETLLLARDFIEKEWNPGDLRIAALQWISPVAKFEPDYYYLEVKEWTWFQYPWTRLEDVQQFIERIFKEDERAKQGLALEELASLFREWYGVDPGDLGFYWDLAVERLLAKGVLAREDGRLVYRGG